MKWAYSKELIERDITAGIVWYAGKAAAYCFHSWRHYFTAYMRDSVNEKLLQRQTGHKTLVMLDHYSGHRIAGERERIQEAQRANFAALLPEGGAAWTETDYKQVGA